MHYQAEPHGESKLVRCVRGAIFDVAVDLRADSPTHCGWHGVELSAENGRSLYIPAGSRTAFRRSPTTARCSTRWAIAYVPEAARGVRWDDPAFGIEWPDPAGELTISEKDGGYPDFRRESRDAHRRHRVRW